VYEDVEVCIREFVFKCNPLIFTGKSAITNTHAHSPEVVCTNATEAKRSVEESQGYENYHMPNQPQGDPQHTRPLLIYYFSCFT